nr:hypothetical protein [Paenibacillus xylanexedens]
MSDKTPYNPNSKAVQDTWRANFDKFNRIIVTWVLKANELKLASETLNKEFVKAIEVNMSVPVGAEIDQREGFGSIWMMLSGYSLECLLKGLYFYINPNENIENGKIVVNWKGSGHDLSTLVALCNEYLQDDEKINLTKDEDNYIKRVSEFTAWAGKYPLPKKYNSMIPTEQMGGFAPLTLIKIGEDEQAYEHLFTRITEIIERKRQ